MNTLIATNILLSAIVISVIILSVLVAILLVHMIGIAKRVKSIVKEFDDDIHRTRSFFIAIKDKVSEFFGKKK